MKRGVIYWVLALALVGIAIGQYCINPCVPDQANYCKQVSSAQCCPPSGYTPTGKNGLSCPPDQSACAGQFYGAFAADCALGCCLSNNNPDISCQDGAIEKISCETAFQGEFRSSCSLIDGCRQGCCCYREQTTRLSRATYVDMCVQLGGEFFPGSYNTLNCSEKCDSGYVPPGQTTKPACSDGVDNDGDGYTDYPADNGCTSADDNSEENLLYECNDGSDNDQDGNIDMADSCCTTPTGVSEGLCDLPQCTISGQVGQGIKCLCQRQQCNGGQYCCVTGCLNVPCGSQTCSQGERQSCGTRDINNCELFRYCEAGTWLGECRKDPMCGVQPEVCHDNLDNDGNTLTDCDDLFCAGVYCGDSAAVCESKGYFDPANNNYKCCYSGIVNDCDSDGIKETCGSCDCQKLHLQPQISNIINQKGERRLTVVITLNCNVPIDLLRCTGTGCTQPSQFMTVAYGMTAREYHDTSIQPNTRYCYLAEAAYPDGTRVQSNIFCRSSGDAICMEMPAGEFCLDEALGLNERRVLRYKCDGFNNLVKLEDCRQKGPDQICLGPDSSGTTRCEQQSNCAECGTPLDMFAIVGLSMGYFTPPGGSRRSMLCDQLPTCYYDYTDTIKDKYAECSLVHSCYDYRSKAACQGDTLWGSTGANNRCLGRDCQWIESRNEFNSGICQEKITSYKQCGYCNIAEHNKVIDDCTLTRCRQFGANSGGCYLDMNGMCTDMSLITCNDYQTSEECTGGQNVAIDVAYSQNQRVSGTNQISARSRDAAGFGLCRWDNTQNPTCFKDANGDTLPDSNPSDMKPPQTRVLTPAQVSSFNFTAVVFDIDDRGISGSGVRAFYYSDTGGYPTQVLYPDSAGVVQVLSGAGHGQHIVSFYSEDMADNLEPVRTFTVNVDKAAPEITLTPYVVHDTTDPFTDSRVSVVVNVSEESVCNDYFEGVPDTSRQIRNSSGRLWVVQYGQLPDGYYRYAVNCTDILGNKGSAEMIIRIDADSAMFNPQPTGIIDYPTVTVSIMTTANVPCKWDTRDLDYSQMENTFSREPSGEAFYHSAQFSPVESRSYSLYAKCNLGARVAKDEIQFVYDALPPKTYVADTYRQPFNFSKWYNGFKDTIYLKCEDQPASGFGCNSTYYCVSNAACTPKNLSDPLQPLKYELTQSQTTWLCYHSTENRLGSMGGKREETVCNQIRIDSIPPYLRDVNIQSHSSAANALVTLQTPFQVTGRVVDPDSQAGTGSNTVTIRVTNGNRSYTYSNIPANDQFSSYVNLTLGLNQITISATDRSGASSLPQTYYIRLVEYLGQKIELVTPSFGVASARTMDLKIKTYKEMECRFSINNLSFDASYVMASVRDGTNNYHTHNGFQHPLSTPGADWPVSFKCRDRDGVIHEQTFQISWDSTKPTILSVKAERANDREIISDFPMSTALVVKTDDYTRCKYSIGLSTEGNSYNGGMYPFQHFPNASDFNGTTALRTINRLEIPSLTDKTSYDYFIQCENGAGLLSDKVRYSFSVDTSIAAAITVISPPKLSRNSTFRFEIKTSKQSTDCKYGANETLINTPMTGNGSFNSFVSGMLSLPEGKYTYWFSCVTAIDILTDSYTFKIDTSPPDIISIEDGNCSPSLTTLSASWVANDTMSEVTQFNYSIGTDKGRTDVMNWTSSTKKSVTALKLNLTEGAFYFWNVMAMNELGMWSAPGYSDGVKASLTCYDYTNLTNTTPIDLCKNKLLDPGETDIDCGGPCPACLDGAVCTNNSDCASRNCKDGKCVAATCTDRIKNQGESDIDCGGALCEKCGLDKNCTINSDCESLYCGPLNKCTEPSCDDGIKNGDEAGIDCGGSCPKACPIPEEACSVNEKGVDWEDADCDNMPDYWEKENDLIVGKKDASEDPDKDGFSNLEEYKKGTDPNRYDEYDYEDTEKGMAWWWWIIIIFVIAGLGVGGYYGYNEYYKKKKPHAQPVMYQAQRTAPPTQKPNLQQKFADTLSKITRQKRKELRDKQREELLSKFDEPGEGKTPAVKASDTKVQKPTEAKKEDKPEKKDEKDAFSELEKITGKKGKQQKAKKALDELSTMVKKKKKAEIANEVFFYIMAVLVIGLLLFFGVKWIGGMVEKWEMARTIKFKVDLEDAVKKQRAKPYSSFEIYTFNVPSKIKKVCFVDKDNFKPFSGLCYEGPPPDPDYNRAFCVLWQSDDPRNVLIEPMSALNTPIELGKIRVLSEPVDQGYICFNTEKEPLKVKLVSLGDATQIARP